DQGVAFPAAARVGVPQLDVLRQVRLAIQVDDARTRVEHDQDVARVLADLVAMPVERLRHTGRRAARQRFDVGAGARVGEVRGEVLLCGTRPRLVRDPAIGRVEHATGRALLAL